MIVENSKVFWIVAMGEIKKQKMNRDKKKNKSYVTGKKGAEGDEKSIELGEEENSRRIN